METVFGDPTYRSADLKNAMTAGAVLWPLVKTRDLSRVSQPNFI